MKKTYLRMLTALVLVLALALGGMSVLAEGEKTTIRFAWWGNDTRNALTQQIIDLYMEKNPNIIIESEFLAFSAYWEKLATQAAAGTLADVMQFNEGQTQTYGRKNLLLALDSYLESGALYVHDTAKNSFGDYTCEDGHIYGINAGSTAIALHYDPAVVEAAGIVIDDTNWTYDDYERIVMEVYEKTGKKADLLLYTTGAALSPYYRNFGTQTYTDDLKAFVMTAEQLAPLFEMEYRLCQGGYTPSYDSYAGEVWGDDPFSKGDTWIRVHWSNELAAAESYAGRPVGLLSMPKVADGISNPYYVRGSMNWSINAKTEHPDECVAFVNWIVNSEEANAILGSERGVSINPDIRAMLAEGASDTLKTTFAFVDKISGMTTVSYKYQAPAGSDEIGTLLDTCVDEMFYGMCTPAEAAENFVSQANEILARKN